MFVFSEENIQVMIYLTETNRLIHFLFLVIFEGNKQEIAFPLSPCKPSRSICIYTLISELWHVDPPMHWLVMDNLVAHAWLKIAIELVPHLDWGHMHMVGISIAVFSIAVFSLTIIIINKLCSRQCLMCLFFLSKDGSQFMKTEHSIIAFFLFELILLWILLFIPWCCFGGVLNS